MIDYPLNMMNSFSDSSANDNMMYALLLFCTEGMFC
jgi:hypothetical protein